MNRNRTILFAVTVTLSVGAALHGRAGSAIRTTDPAVACAADTRALRHWTRERDDRILQRDGLPPGPHPNYEVDHRVPLCLGGSDDDANLWAQPRRSIEPVWNAERKDELEARLCQLVCSGQLDLGSAQREIATDWQTVYRKYFQLAGRPPTPFCNSGGACTRWTRYLPLSCTPVMH
jgi:hypothetical protein